MIRDHPMGNFLLNVQEMGDQEARSSSLRGLSLGHKPMRVDLSEPRMSFDYTSGRAEDTYSSVLEFLPVDLGSNSSQRR